MASSEFGTGKSIVVLAIVVGCFAILWPKIFYPMMQAAFAITAPRPEDEQSFRPRDRPPHLQPGMLSPNAREPTHDGTFVKEGRPFPHPSSRQPVKPQSKSGGAMSIIMPIYTIGIVVFFLYTVLKLVFKKSPENEKKPLIKDFHMDPQYHKFVCQQSAGKNARKPTKQAVSIGKSKEQSKSSIFDEKNGNFDEKDYEIYKLRRKLEETESAMERIMKHMGAVSDSLSNACLFKDDSSVDKEASKAHSGSEMHTSNNKPSLRVNKKKRSVFKAASALKKLIQLHQGEECAGDKTKNVSCSGDSNQENAAEDLECKVKRDSSINSETSSFELLSQCLGANSNADNSSDCESDNADCSKSSDVVDNASFEASEKKSDEVVSCGNDVEPENKTVTTSETKLVQLNNS